MNKILLLILFWGGIGILWSQERTLTINSGHDEAINAICFSPDGNFLATGSNDNTAKLWDISSQKLIRTFRGHIGRIIKVGFDSSGTQLFTVGRDNTIKKWEVNSGKLITDFQEKIPLSIVNNAFFSTDNKNVTLIGCRYDWEYFDNYAAIYDLKSGKKIEEFSIHGVEAANFNSESNQFASFANGREIELKNLNFETNRQGRIFLSHPFKKNISIAIFSSKNEFLASDFNDNTIKIWEVSSGKLLKTFRGHIDEIESIIFSPNDQMIASTSRGKTKIWDVLSGKLLQVVEGWVSSICFSPDNRLVATGRLNSVKIWDVKSGSQIFNIEGHYLRNNRHGIFSHNSKIFAHNTSAGIMLWNMTSGQLFRYLKSDYRGSSTFSFSPNDTLIASAIYGSDEIELWEVTSGDLIETFKGHVDEISSIHFSPDNSLIVSGDKKGVIKLREVASGDLIQTFEGHIDEITVLRISPDGKQLISGSEDHTIKLWDIHSGELLGTTYQRFSSLVDFYFNSNNIDQVIAISLDDKQVVLWDVNNGNRIKNLSRLDGDINSISINFNSELVASKNENGAIFISNMIADSIIHSFQYESEDITDFCLSPNNKLFASITAGHILQFRELESGLEVIKIETLDGGDAWISMTANGKYSANKAGLSHLYYVKGTELFPLLENDSNFVPLPQFSPIQDMSLSKGENQEKVHAEKIETLVFSPLSTLLASGSRDRTIKIWDVKSGQILGTLEGHTESINCINFSSDGKLLASASRDSTVKLWGIDSLELLHTLVGHTNEALTVSISADKQMIASGGMDNEINIWDVTSGELLNTLAGHATNVRKISFSPDAKLLASGSNDKIILWDARSGKLLKTFGKRSSPIEIVTFSPDGKFLVTGNSGKRYTKVKFWDVASGKLIRTVKRYPKGIKTFSFSSDGNEIYSSSSYSVWIRDSYNDDSKKRHWIDDFETVNWSDKVNSVTFSPNDSLLAISFFKAGKPEIKLWEIDSFNLIQTLNIQEIEKQIVPSESFGQKTQDRYVPIINWVNPIPKTVSETKLKIQARINSEDSITYYHIRHNNSLVECPIDTEGQLQNCEISLSKRVNKVSIKATNKAGLGESTLWEFEYIPANKPRNYALVIATENYKDKKTWGRMYSAVSGAKRLEKILKGTFNFEVETITDPSLFDVQEKLNYYANKDYGKYDQLLIVFTGHGDLDIRPGGGEVGFLVMKDSEMVNGIRRNFLRHSTLVEEAKTIGCPHVFVLLDACYSSTFDTSIDNPLSGGTEPKGKYLKRESDLEKKVMELLDKKSRLYLSSGRSRTLSGDSKKASPFFEAFLAALQHFEYQKDRIVRFGEIKSFIENQKLYPMPKGGYFGGQSMAGDFLFILNK